MSTALVTGGGRGIGASIAHALAEDGFDVVVAARTFDQVQSVAGEIGGRAVQMDVADRGSVEAAFEEIGHVDLLVANAGVGRAEFWRTFEVNVLGVEMCCRAALAHGSSRIVITGSGSAYLPGMADTAYASSKAAVCRYAETLNNELDEVPVFVFSPGLVRTEMTSWAPDDAPWTPPECAPALVRKLATGRYDALAGRYLHAEHDDVDDLLARIDEVQANDLNAIRLQR